MHYYQFNIGDYSSHTKHLTPIEDICYRRLLDWYYLHEKPIPKDIKSVARMIMLNDCATDVEQVLNEFFQLTKNGWINQRADKEIEAYQNKISANSKAGKISAEKRKTYSQQALNERATNVQPNNNQEPLTINQETLNTHIGEICKKIISIGINPINPSNPTFTTLVESGATIGEFEYAALQAKKNNKGFSYLLAIVKNEREQAKNLNIHTGAMPAKQNSRDADRLAAANTAFGSIIRQDFMIEEKDITNESAPF